MDTFFSNKVLETKVDIQSKVSHVPFAKMYWTLNMIVLVKKSIVVNQYVRSVFCKFIFAAIVVQHA